MEELIKYFGHVTPEDIAKTGEKALTLVLLKQQQPVTGIPIPDGFIITAANYNRFINHNKLADKLDALLQTIDTVTYENLPDVAAQCRRLVCNGKFPREAEAALTKAYATYFPNDQSVAVRNSPTGTNLPAGLADSYLNIRGVLALTYAVKCCFASLFTDRAIKYYVTQNIKFSDVSMAVMVQKMVRSDIGISGTLKYDGKNSVIKGTWGLGEILWTDEAQPDVLIYNDQQLLQKVKGKKGHMSTYVEFAAGTNSTQLKITPAEIRDEFSVPEAEAEKLLDWLPKVESTTGIEWAKDGLTNTYHLINIYKQ